MHLVVVSVNSGSVPQGLITRGPFTLGVDVVTTTARCFMGGLVTSSVLDGIKGKMYEDRLNLDVK